MKSVIKLLALCGALLVTLPVSAQSFIFLADPGDWDTGANWDIGVVPDPTANVFIGEDGTVPTATANITGPLSQDTVNDIRIGAGTLFGGAEGTLNHSGGTINTDGWVFVGLDAPAGGDGNTGTYNLSGTATFNNLGEDKEFHVGIGGGAGASNEGFVNVQDSAVLNLAKGYIGSNDGNSGTLTQTGGEVVVGDWLAIGREGGAQGTYNISGGSLTVTNDFLTLGESGAGTSGRMNVSGDASINTANMAIGRPLAAPGSEGLLSIAGDGATINTGSLVVGINDQAGFTAAEATGTVRFESSTTSVTTIEVSGDAYLNDGTMIGQSLLEVDFTAAPTTGDITLVTVGGTLNGIFAGLPEGTVVPDSGGRTISYTGNQIRLLAEGGMTVTGDFNGDNLWNCLDIDLLSNAIATGSNDLAFDMNGDGMITPADVTDANVGWLAVGGAENPGQTNGNPFLEGDANLDGVVDGQDFVIWNSNKFTNGTHWCDGNFSLNTTIDGQDFILWNANKFTSSDFAAVPEPSFVVSLLGCLGGLSLLRRRS
ncbi:MAG: dockerin type I domain-containing protein [Planctomycetota bacterium]